MALKIVYKIYCGIDVQKTFVVACIASTNKLITYHFLNTFLLIYKANAPGIIIIKTVTMPVFNIFLSKFILGFSYFFILPPPSSILPKISYHK